MKKNFDAVIPFIIVIGVISFVVFTYVFFLYDSIKPNILIGEWETTLPNGDYLKLGFSKSFAWSSINNFPDQMGDYEVDQDDGVWIKVPALGSGISKGTISVVHDNIIILDLDDYPPLKLNRILDSN